MIVTYNGVTIECELAALSGLDMPGVRTGDEPRASAHGMIRGDWWHEGRTVVMEMVLEATDATALATRVAEVTGAFVVTSDERPLVWQLPGESQRRILARCRRRAHVVDIDYLAGVAHVAVEMASTDPRIYAAAASSASTTLATSGGGLSFPATAPFVFGSSTSSSVMSCPNAGTFATPWTATLTGPLVAPELVLVGSGLRLSFPSASLAAGEQLMIDSAARTVLLGGTASRYGWLAQPAGWFDLAAGANSVQLLGASGAGGVSMSWRAAWI